jgi:hypothetical protein
VHWITKVEERCDKLPWSGCWIWKGYLDNGYARLSSDLGFRGVDLGIPYVRRIHRAIANPRQLPGEVRHLCGVRCCLNPEHLVLGTTSENQVDRVRFGPHNTRTLSEEDVQAIRKDGRSQRTIAKEYRVTQPLISAIKLNKIWKHVP